MKSYETSRATIGPSCVFTVGLFLLEKASDLIVGLDLGVDRLYYVLTYNIHRFQLCSNHMYS